MIDLDGDAVPDLVVLEASGPKVFINNTSGSLSLASTKTVPQSKAIEVTDINRDGYKDLVIATSGGVSIQLADTHLSWPSTQTIQSGDTENLLLHDFDNDGYSDLVTVDSSGTVRFYKNRRSQGFAEVGGPVQLHGYGNMLVQDADNDGQMDVVVEIEPGVNEVVSIGSIFGIQPIQPGGKRSVRYVLFDHLGSAKMLINDQCEVVWPDYGIREVNKLLPFGQERLVRLNSSEIAYNLNFTNKELDRDLELNYFGARYYHPELPRFISPDPVGGKPEIPMSWNRYLYCRNDPINYFDPDGEDVDPANSITGNQLIQIIREFEKPYRHNAVLALKEFNKAGTNYYLEAKGVGTLNAVDVKHMLTMAFYAFSNGQRTGMGKLWGHVNEIFQKVTGSSSEYDPEDIPSNNLGAQFGKSLQIETLLSVQLELFLIQAGVNMNDQASLDAFKKAIEEYNSSHQNDEENCYSDSNPPPESNATNAANESMWARKDHPSGYRGRE